MFIAFLDATLRGCAQVMFQNNPVTGLLFFIAIFISAYGNGDLMIAYGCVIGTVVATLTGLVIGEKKTWRVGLYGYNGCLVGAALPIFLDISPITWSCIVVGSIISVFFMRCIADFLKVWKVPALTAPFVFTTWIILLASYSFSSLKNSRLPYPQFPHHIGLMLTNIGTSSSVIHGLFFGVSQVFLLSSFIGGCFFIVGLAIESLWAAVFAIFGSTLAIAIATTLGADHHSIYLGLYSFSAVLTAIALGTAFNKTTWKGMCTTVIAVIFTVVIQGAFNALLEPVGIPTLTIPFILATWLFLVISPDSGPNSVQC